MIPTFVPAVVFVPAAPVYVAAINHTDKRVRARDEVQTRFQWLDIVGVEMPAGPDPRSPFISKRTWERLMGEWKAELHYLEQFHMNDNIVTPR